MSSINDALAKAKIIIMQALKREPPSMSRDQVAARGVILAIEEHFFNTLKRKKS